MLCFEYIFLKLFIKSSAEYKTLQKRCCTTNQIYLVLSLSKASIPQVDLYVQRMLPSIFLSIDTQIPFAYTASTLCSLICKTRFYHTRTSNWHIQGRSHTMDAPPMNALLHPDIIPDFAVGVVARRRKSQ
jgi:hypothetical protein